LVWCEAVLGWGGRGREGGSNVRGEPVFSVMVAGWFWEKSGWIGKAEDVQPVLWRKKIQPVSILRRRIFTRMNCEIGRFHPVWFISDRISSGSRV
jgi:hypothetical protein